MAGFLPFNRLSPIQSEAKQTAEKICDWRFVGAHGREGDGLCDINFGMGNLMGGTIGQYWDGGARSWWFYVFSDVAAPFLGRKRPGRREK